MTFFIVYAFFLYPVGHFGLIALTFLIVLPLTQVIETFEIATLVEAGVVDGETVEAGSDVFWVSFTLIVGSEKVKLAAESRSHPFLSEITVVATC